MKILLPTDGSACSTNAVEFFVSRTSLLGAHPQLVLLTVQQPLSAIRRLLVRGDEQAYYDAEAERALAPARRVLRAEGVDFTEQKALGDPAEQIAEAVAREKPDLILMGSRGLSAFAGLILGSVTTEVLARTRTPVLIVRGKEEPRKDALRVAIAVDGSEYGQAAARYVVGHLELFGQGAKFHAINVVTTLDKEYYSVVAAVSNEKLTKKDMKLIQYEDFVDAMKTVRPIFKAAGLKVKEVCLTGDPADQIADYAEENRLDLIVMGSHGYGNFKSAVMGSVATHVAAQGNVPILLIRTETHIPPMIE